MMARTPLPEPSRSTRSTIGTIYAIDLPDPVRPTWDQLVNGSLDAQYVEVQGIIAAVNTNIVTLLMREGRINVELRVPGLAPAAVAGFENALVRVRATVAHDSYERLVEVSCAEPVGDLRQRSTDAFHALRNFDRSCVRHCRVPAGWC